LQLLPKNSYIDALSIKSQHLAKFLLKIGSKVKLYNKYLECKNEYEVYDTDTNWSLNSLIQVNQFLIIAVIICKSDGSDEENVGPK
jgi:hypothetical protein